MEEHERIAGNTELRLEDVLKEFDAVLLDEGRCRGWFIRKLYPAGAVCPSCGRVLTKKQQDLFFLSKRVTCKACGRWFNERTGTIFSGTHATYGEAMLLMLLLGLGQPARIIASILGYDEETVRIWRKKFERGQ
ncbi:MAG: IS1 family transposase [Syntrophorhabdaceae bacterium]|nr:IS1 family transposase [Syntrophorhabdaceae bacterium]